MRLILLLFITTGLLITSNVLAKGLLHFNLDCRTATFYGTVDGTKIHAVARYTWEPDQNRWRINLRAKNYPNTDKNMLMHIAKGLVAGTASKYLKRRKVIMIITGMKNCPTHKPKVIPQAGPGEYPEQEIIKTGLRIVIREKEEEGCV